MTAHPTGPTPEVTDAEPVEKIALLRAIHRVLPDWDRVWHIVENHAQERIEVAVRDLTAEVERLSAKDVVKELVERHKAERDENARRDGYRCAECNRLFPTKDAILAHFAENGDPIARGLANANGTLAATIRSMNDSHERARVAEDRAARLEAAIRTVLDDEESRPGGWGPDVTMVAVLRAALAGGAQEGGDGA